MSKDTCIKANSYCPICRGVCGSDCWHDFREEYAPATTPHKEPPASKDGWARERVKKLEAEIQNQPHFVSAYDAVEAALIEAQERGRKAGLEEALDIATESWTDCEGSAAIPRLLRARLTVPKETEGGERA